MYRLMNWVKLFFKSIALWFDGNKADISVHKTAIVWGRDNLSLQEGSYVWEYSILRCREGTIRVGSNTDIGPYTAIFSGDDGVYIGSNVLIAPHCVIASGNHRIDDTSIPIREAGGTSKGPITIEDDVWIGANCTITSGVTIKKGSVIGANSVVTRDTDEYSINFGNPARFIRKR